MITAKTSLTAFKDVFLLCLYAFLDTSQLLNLSCARFLQLFQSFIEHYIASAVASLLYGMLPKCCITEYGPFTSFPSF